MSTTQSEEELGWSAAYGDGGLVPHSARWPIPVIARDTNYLLQSATLLLYPDDIEDFLEEELYAMDWCKGKLKEVMEEIYRTGSGTLDPAALQNDHTERDEFWAHDKRHGFQDAPELQQKSFAESFYPRPSEIVDPQDLETMFLCTVNKSDTSLANARRMRARGQGGGLSVHALPLIEEEAHVTPSEAHPCPVNYVGPAKNEAVHSKRKRKARTGTTCWRNAAAGSWDVDLAGEPTSEVRVEPRRCKQGKRASFEFVIMNSSGAPQLLAALETCNDEVLMVVNQEHQTQGARFVDLQYDAHNAGWHLHGSPAAKTVKDGLSAGVAIAVRKSVGRGLVHDRTDHSPRMSPGRLTAVWIQAGPDTGLLVASVYLYTLKACPSVTRS